MVIEQHIIFFFTEMADVLQQHMTMDYFRKFKNLYMIQHVAFSLDDNYSQCIELVMAGILINNGSIFFPFLIWNTKGRLNIKALQYLF